MCGEATPNLPRGAGERGRGHGHSEQEGAVGEGRIWVNFKGTVDKIC